VALDYNAPLLTIAAAHIMNDTADPFFTRLAAGEYDKRRPNGRPCDASTSCNGQVHLPTAAKVVMGVVISIVGLIIVGLVAVWVFYLLRDRTRRPKSS
jgi:endoglucanase